MLTQALARTPNQHGKMLAELSASDHPQDSSPSVAGSLDFATYNVSPNTFTNFGKVTFPICQKWFWLTLYISVSPLPTRVCDLNQALDHVQ